MSQTATTTASPGAAPQEPRTAETETMTPSTSSTQK